MLINVKHVETFVKHKETQRQELWKWKKLVHEPSRFNLTEFRKGLNAKNVNEGSESNSDWKRSSWTLSVSCYASQKRVECRECE